MSGHVRVEKSTGKWLYSVELGLDEQGKRRRKVKKGFRTRKEAKLAMAEVLLDVQKQRERAKNNDVTLGYFLDYWLQNYAQQNTSPNTYKGYERMIRVHLKPELGDIYLSELTTKTIQDYYTRKLKPPITSIDEHAKGLSAQTIKHHHRLLTKVLNDAVDFDFVSRNVAKKAKPPRPEKYHYTTYNAFELKQLFESAKSNKVYYPVIYLAAHTGAREGELWALTWDDVDFENNRIYIRKTASRVKGKGIVIRHTTKSGKQRSIAIGKSVMSFLLELKQKHEENKKKQGETFNPDNLVLPNSKGNYICVRDLGRAFQNAIETAGLPKIRFHDLRHTHATVLLQNNVHPKIVSERLGHSNINVTLDTYSHVIPSLQEGAAELFDQAFK